MSFNAENGRVLNNQFRLFKTRLKNCWYLPDINAIRNEIGMTPKTEPGKAVISQIHPINRAALKRMHELLLLKAYSPNTIRTYCIEFSQLLYLLKNVHADTLTSERLRSYLLYCVRQNLSENMIHSRMNAIKFYFEQVLHHEKFFFEEIPRPQKRASLPKVMSKSDISKIFKYINNLKHLMMLKLCYGMGLRVSESAEIHGLRHSYATHLLECGTDMFSSQITFFLNSKSRPKYFSRTMGFSANSSAVP